jgi:AAA domain
MTRIIDGIEYEEDGRGSLVPIAEVIPITRPSRFVSPAGLKPRPARWLWDGRIPVGVATLIAGVPGQGKSHVCLDIAARVTRGELEGDFEGDPGGVVVMSSEDMLLETIVPRLMAAGGDMSRVFVLPFTDDGFDLKDDLGELEILARERHVRLVILDPLLAFTPGDGFKEAEVRRMLQPAQRLMQEHRLAMLGVMHLNKDVMMDVLSRVTHSQAFTALVRSVLFVGADPDDEDELNPQKVLAHGKSNLSRIAPSIGFRLAETAVAGEDEAGNEIGVTTSTVVWLGDSEVTDEQLVKGRGSPGTKQAQAEALLRRLCPVHKATALREAEAKGISQSTLERAYRNLGGVPSTDLDRDPDTGQLQPGIWRLPPPLMKRGE